MSTIGERIKKIRKAKNMTQQKFADDLGLKQNTIATYEMNKTIPSERTLSDICEKFGVDPVWLRTGVGDGPFLPVSVEDIITERLSQAISGASTSRDRLIRALARLPDNAFPLIEEYILDAAESILNEKKE